MTHLGQSSNVAARAHERRRSGVGDVVSVAARRLRPGAVRVLAFGIARTRLGAIDVVRLRFLVPGRLVVLPRHRHSFHARVETRRGALLDRLLDASLGEPGWTQTL